MQSDIVDHHFGNVVNEARGEPTITMSPLPEVMTGQLVSTESLPSGNRGNSLRP